MTEPSIIERLRLVDPDLVAPADRLARVRRRVVRRRRVRALSVGGLAAVAAALAVTLGSGGARDASSDVATDVGPTPSTTMTRESPVPPGRDRQIPLSEPVTIEHTGTGTVELGRHPDTATGVSISFTCLTGGHFDFPDGASVQCSSGDDHGTDGRPTSPGYIYALDADATSFVMKADADARWRVSAHYVRVVHTPWGVNAAGQTYGVSNDRGDPDLVAVVATEGRDGYAYATDLSGPLLTSPAEAATMTSGPRDIPVYESDGVTQVGTFHLAG